MDKYCIITPTYKPHFKYIKKYLQSFDKFVVDKDKIAIVFTVDTDEINDLKQLIEPFISKVNIVCMDFNKILQDNHVYMSSSDVLTKYGKYSFQSLKKIYTMLSIDADKFLVLDSETIWIKPTSMEELFQTYFKKPTIWGSYVNRKQLNPFLCNLQDNMAYIYDFDVNFWFLENFMWFYDKKILINLFDEYGSPFDLVDKVFKNKYKDGIFEILLYYNYILKNLERYNYSFINVVDYAKNNLEAQVWDNYYFNWMEKFGGCCGVLEHTMALVNKENVVDFANLFKKLGFNIIRSEGKRNINEQLKFVEICQPNILAASQENVFVKKSWRLRSIILKFLSGLFNR